MTRAQSMSHTIHGRSFTNSTIATMAASAPNTNSNPSHIPEMLHLNP